MRTVSATQFRTKCLSLLDEVERTGGEVVITKRGRVVARLLPLAPAAEHWKLLLGTVHWDREEDIVGPMDVPWPGEGDD